MCVTGLLDSDIVYFFPSDIHILLDLAQFLIKNELMTMMLYTPIQLHVDLFVMAPGTETAPCAGGLKKKNGRYGEARGTSIKA